MSVLDDRLVLRIGPLEEGATADTARRRVVEPLVDGVGVDSAGRVGSGSSSSSDAVRAG